MGFEILRSTEKIALNDDRHREMARRGRTGFDLVGKRRRLRHDRPDRGDEIFMPVEADAGGHLVRLLIESEDAVYVGQSICEIETGPQPSPE
jgi:hypothetical protein